MSAIQGAFGALLGSLNFLLKYGLLASCLFFAASTHFLKEGGSYVGLALNIGFFNLFLRLVLAPNPNFTCIFGSSHLRPHCHTRAKVWAVFFWLLGIYFLHLEVTRDNMFLREPTTICMTASVAFIAPVTRCEASVRVTNGNGDRPTSTGKWKKIALAYVLLASVVFFSSQAGVDTSADGSLAHPMFVNDTIIVNDICPLRPEVPVETNLTIPSTSVPPPDFITTLGTPCQVTPTPAPPSPEAKSTWVPAAMSTAMPTPEPAPTALPEVKPGPDVEPDPEPEPQPQTVAAPQDVAGALELLVKLFTSEAKSILSPQAKSALSWYLSLRVEDHCAAVLLAAILAWYLFSRLVAVVALVSASSILPITCFLSSGLFFCLQRYAVPRNLSLTFSVLACVVLIVAIVSAAFVAYFLRLLRLVRLVKGNASELPTVKSDISKLFDNLSRLVSSIETVQHGQSTLKNTLAEAGKAIVDLATAFGQSAADTNQRFKGLLGVFQGGLIRLNLRMKALKKRLTALESRGRRINKLMAYLNKRVGELQRSKADSAVVEKLLKELQDLRSQFGELGNNAADDEACKKLEKKLKELSEKVDGLSKDFRQQITEIWEKLGSRALESMESLGLVTARVDKIEEDIIKLEAGRKVDKKASDESASGILSQLDWLKEKLTTALNTLVGKEDLKKVQDDCNKRVDESEKARREEQAKSDARVKASEEENKRLRDEMAAQRAETDKRFEKLEAKVDDLAQSHKEEKDHLNNAMAAQKADSDRQIQELKANSTKKDDTPPALHPDVVRKIKIDVQTLVAKQLLFFFRSHYFLRFMCALVFTALQRLGSMGLNFPPILLAAVHTPATAPQQASSLALVPRAARLGRRLRHSLHRAALLNGGLIGSILPSSFRRRWPALLRVLSAPGGERFLLSFISTLPRSLPPPRSRRSLLPGAGGQAATPAPGGDPGDPEPDGGGGGGSEDPHQAPGGGNTPEAPQEPGSGGQGEAPKPEQPPTPSSPPADDASEDREPLSGAPHESRPEDPQTQPPADTAGPEGDEADAAMRGGPPNAHRGTEDAPNGSRTGGHPQDPNVEDPPNAHRGTNDAPDGSRTGGHPQGPDGTAPEPSPSEDGGSHSTGDPDGNASDGDDNASQSTAGRGRPLTVQQAGRERQDQRKAVQGFPINPENGRVTDPEGRTVGCIQPLNNIKRDYSRVGKFVNCLGNTRQIWGNNKPIAKLWLRGESEFEKWVKKHGDDEEDESEDEASAQSPGGNRPSSATRGPPLSSGPANPSASDSHAGPSPDGPGRDSFREPSGSQPSGIMGSKHAPQPSTSGGPPSAPSSGGIMGSKHAPKPSSSGGPPSGSSSGGPVPSSPARRSGDGSLPSPGGQGAGGSGTPNPSGGNDTGGSKKPNTNEGHKNGGSGGRGGSGGGRGGRGGRGRGGGNCRARIGTDEEDQGVASGAASGSSSEGHERPGVPSPGEAEPGLEPSKKKTRRKQRGRGGRGNSSQAQDPE